MRERVTDDLRLLVNLLRHEVAIIALVHEEGGGRRSEHGTFDFAAFGVVDFDAVARKHGRVAILEIRDRIGKRSERDGVGAEIHFAVPIADRERRSLARTNEEIVFAREQEGERECAPQPRQRSRHRVGRRAAVLHLPRHEVGDHLGISVRAELRARLFELLTQLAEILDDAVVNDGKALGGVRMRIAFGRPAVGRPAGVADTDGAGERLTCEPGFEIAQLAFGPPPDELSAFQRRDAGGVVAPVFEPLERIDKQARDRLTPEGRQAQADNDRGGPRDRAAGLRRGQGYVQGAWRHLVQIGRWWT